MSAGKSKKFGGTEASMALVDELVDRHEGCTMLRMDGYDDCVVGTVESFGRAPVLLYSVDKIIARHVADGMDILDAQEFFEFNQAGAYAGPGTPAFAYGMPA